MPMYNTGNPVGSTAPKDLYDNAQVLDKLVVGTDPMVVDRLGAQRYSWAGMEYDFNAAQAGRNSQFEAQLGAMGYTWVGDYGPGLVFTSRNQYTVRDGIPYAVANETTLPYTTTGNWATEVSKFKVISADDILRGDLIKPDGASLVGYKNSTVLSRLDQMPSLLDFTSDPESVTDWSPVLTAALAVTTNLYIPAGKFNFNGKVSYTFTPPSSGPADNKNNYKSINIYGAGPDNTILHFPGSDGLEFICQSFQHTVHLHGFSVTTGRTNGGIGINLRNRFAFFGSYTAQHDFSQIVLRGDDGYGDTFYWSTCVELFNITAFNMDACSLYGPVASATSNTYGKGLRVYSSTTPGIATSSEPGCGTSYNFTNCNFVFLGRAFEIGTLVQAFKIGTGCAILNGYDGVFIPSGGLDIRQLTLSGVEISVNGNAVEMNTACSGSLITGCYIAVASGKNGVVLAGDEGAMNSGGTCITGNTFVPLGVGSSDGVYVGSTYAPVTVTGNTFLGLTRGIELAVTSAQVHVTGNAYMNCTQNVLNNAGPANDIGFDESVAWVPYTAPATAGSGTLGTSATTAYYKKCGKIAKIRAKVDITTNGSGALNLRIPLPATLAAKYPQAATGRENSLTGASTSAVVDGTLLIFTKFDGTYPGANGASFTLAAEYEIN